MKKLLLCPLLVLVSAIGCATTEVQGERDPNWEKGKLDRRKEIDKLRRSRRDVNELLLELNRLLENYYTARKAPHNREVERFIENLKKAISERTEKYFDDLVAGIEAKLAEAGPDDLKARKVLALETARLGARLYSESETVAWCGVLAPFDLLHAMGVTSCFVEFVGATLAYTGAAAPPPYSLDGVFPRYTGYDPLVPTYCVTPDLDRCMHRFHLS